MLAETPSAKKCLCKCPSRHKHDCPTHHLRSPASLAGGDIFLRPNSLKRAETIHCMMHTLVKRTCEEKVCFCATYADSNPLKSSASTSLRHGARMISRNPHIHWQASRTSRATYLSMMCPFCSLRSSAKKKQRITSSVCYLTVTGVLTSHFRLEDSFNWRLVIQQKT
ncbi:hypothetical protein BJX62DRAFT_87586 [Aspergillus germanicus]